VHHRFVKHSPTHAHAPAPTATTFFSAPQNSTVDTSVVVSVRNLLLSKKLRMSCEMSGLTLATVASA
jgi:hypothetical protein